MSSSSVLALASLAASLAAVFALGGADDAARDRRLVDAALRAAPRHVADRAAVVAMDVAGAVRTLRRGRNGFACMPDDPATPGPDPSCMDAVALAWTQARLARRPPPVGRIGVVYRWGGRRDAATSPPGRAGAGLAIVGADAAFHAVHPRGADPDALAPYVTGAGTPYAQLVIPLE